METFNLKEVVGLAGSIMLAFVYGIVVSNLFYRQDQQALKMTSVKRFCLFIGLPLVVAVLPFIGPDAKTLEPILGRLFPIYSFLCLSFLTFLVPATVSGVLVLVKKTHPKRWLFSSYVFNTGVIIMICRTGQILIHAKK